MTIKKVSPSYQNVDLELPTSNVKKAIACVSSIDGLEEACRGDENEGFITEHRRSPPLDLSFKPIQTFSDTNPFGVFQTPVTPVKQEKDNMEVGEMFITGIAPTSYISLRKSTDCGTAFEDLESPTDVPMFEPPPCAQSSMLLGESLDKDTRNINDITQELFRDERNVNDITQELSRDERNVNEITQELLPDEPSDKGEEEYEETSFSTAPDQRFCSLEKPLMAVDVAGLLKDESKILRDEAEHEDPSKHKDELEVEAHSSSDMDITPEIDLVPIAVSVDYGNDLESAALDQSKQNNVITQNESEPDAETKAMNLEFESQITCSKAILEERTNPDEGFEIISKEELNFETENFLNRSFQVKEQESSLTDFNHTPKELVELVTPEDTINEPSKTEDLTASSDEDVIIVEPPAPELVDLTSSANNLNQLEDSNIMSHQTSPIKDTIMPEQKKLLNAIEVSDFAFVQETPLTLIEPEATSAPVEPILKVVSYQTLTPTDELKLSKTELYLTGQEGCEKSQPLKEMPKTTLELVLADLSVPDIKLSTSQLEFKSLPEPVVVQKSEPAQCQVVTETLIATLEEKSDVAPPSVTNSEVIAGLAQMPCPTPTPALATEQPPQADILVATDTTVGAVAAGSAIFAETVKKTSTSTIAAKKVPTPAGAKKPTDSKVSVKPATVKAPVTKPNVKGALVAAAKSTSAPIKPAGTAKLAPMTKTTVVAKHASTMAKTTVATPAKPTVTDVKKPAPTKPAVPKPTTAGTTRSAPPNKLAVNKTATSLQKPSSKPTTPNSNPITPTTPQSPGAKDLVRSPPKVPVRSTLARPNTALVSNGDVKAVPKKTEVPAKKPVPVAGAKPAPAKAVPATITKTTTTAGKLAVKPASVPLAKTKPAPSTTPNKAVSSAPIKRPATAPASTKPGDKVVKDATIKPATKLAVNGKAVPTKMVNGIKKLDVKGDKIAAKPVKTGSSEMIQVDNITTSNGFLEQADIKEIINVAPVDRVLN